VKPINISQLQNVQQLYTPAFVQYPRSTFSSSSSRATVAAARPARFFSLSRELSSMCCRTPTRMSICVHSRRTPSIAWRMRASGAATTTHTVHGYTRALLELPRCVYCLTTIGCLWRTRAKRCITANVLQTNVDARRDKLATELSCARSSASEN